MPNPIAIFLPNRLCRERIEYLCDLENIEYTLLEDTTSFAMNTKTKPFVVGRADTPRDYKALTTLLGGPQNLILQTAARASTFPNKEEESAFFSGAGVAILQDTWHDLAFRRILREIKQAEVSKNYLQIQHFSRIVLHKLGSKIHGITENIGYHACSCSLFGAENIGSLPCEFSLHIAPGIIAHGKCKALQNPSTPSRTRLEKAPLVTLEFLEFDGISRGLIDGLVNSKLSLQKTDYGKLEATDKDHFAHLEESLEPFLAFSGLSLQLKSSPFDAGNFAGNNGFLTQLVSKFLLQMAAHFPIPDVPKQVFMQLRENASKTLCLFLSIPVPSQAKLALSENLALESYSPMSNLISNDDLELLQALGLRAEQYLDEPHEHIAICLEEALQ